MSVGDLSNTSITSAAKTEDRRSTSILRCCTHASACTRWEADPMPQGLRGNAQLSRSDLSQLPAAILKKPVFHFTCQIRASVSPLGTQRCKSEAQVLYCTAKLRSVVLHFEKICLSESHRQVPKSSSFSYSDSHWQRGPQRGCSCAPPVCFLFSLSDSAALESHFRETGWSGHGNNSQNV